MTEPPASREGLSVEAKRALVARLLREQAEGAVQPLSEGQKALWFLYQMAPQSAAYNVAFTATVRSPLDVEALRRAFRSLMERHAMLRTTFTTRGGEPVQRVGPAFLPQVDEQEAASWSEAALQAHLVESCRRPFDLAAGPVFRLDVCHRGPAEHVLLLTVHHVACDGLSIGFTVADWMAFYAGETTGAQALLEPLPAAYVDFVRWQKELIASPEGETLRAYWTDHLAGPLPVLQLPTDRPRPPEPTFRGGTHSFRIDEATTQRLRDLAKAQGTTLYVLLLAIFGTLLHRYTAQDDILVGSPTAGRSRREFEELIGYFVNPVVMRLGSRGDPSFASYLAGVRETVVAALRHADYPFPLIVQELNPNRDLSRSPLFQVDFNLMRVGQLGMSGESNARDAISRFTMGGLDLETFTIPQQEGQFDLTFELVDTGRELAANLKYASDLFEPATIARMAGHIAQLIAAALDAPGERLSRLRMLTQAETDELTAGTAVRLLPPGAPLHERFAAQAARAPNATAATCDGKSLTYIELDRRANQLARRLRELGARPNTLVGLRSERNLEMVIGILGILKSGAAYLPMDPAYPRDRLSFMLEDSGTTIAVTDSAFAAEMRELVKDVVVVEDTNGSAPPLAPLATADDLAYVIYTSGSTGRPKGVEITHHNVGRLMDATNAWYGFDAADVWTLFHSYAFDFSVWELWGALLYGGRLVVVPQWVSRSPDAFRTLLVDEKVTVLNQTPAAFRQLVATDFTAGPADYSLRYVIFGGEALELQSLRPWFERYGDERPLLVNMYGITETTVHVTYRPIRMRDVEEGAGSVIGRPIPDLRVRLLDAHGGLVPVGVAGEMYVGGDGVARGYLGRPQLTAERFVADPFDPAAGRLYRSGDLARQLADGDLEYLGRIDHQVKIRGYRIELGEIEAAIAAMPGVREAFVMARDDGGDRRLAAYVALRDPALAAGNAIKDGLRGSLPEYMVPAHVVFLDSLPLTANGKVDRARLPAPQAAGPAERPFNPPRTQVEEIIAGLWAEVLGAERVGTDDDFFELGGHSLSVTQVVTRVRKVFGAPVPFRDLFAAPTLAAYAARVDAARSGVRGTASAVPLVATPDAGENPLSSAQQRLWFLNELGGDTAEYAIVGAVEMTGELEVPALESALAQLVARHESLRSVFVLRDGEPVQVVQPAAAAELRIEATTEAGLDERMKAVAARRFDLERGPLFRSTLYRMATDRHVLQLAMHHIIADGWSLGVLMHDLGALYADAVLGRNASLAPPLLQYRDYARWQRQQRDRAHEGAVARWQERLAGAPRELELPGDRPRPPVESHRGAVHTFSLPEDLASGLRQLSRKQGTTLFMTLLALFDTLLWKYTGQEDLVVGTPVANRPRVELESLVGVFVNTLLLRTRLDAFLSFAELLGRVRETTLDSLGDEDVPFERLVEAMRPDRDLGRNPLFQVMFVLQNMPLRPLDLPGLQTSARAVDRGAAQLDLTLHFQETADGLTGFIEYATDLFDAARIARMAGHFEQLARAATADPTARLADLGLLTAAELAELRGWNETAQPAPSACVQDLVAATTARQPDATAVVFGDAALTYSQLEARATAIALRLTALGVRPGSLVCVLLERGLDMVPAVLGVLKAGAAYVPMDPAFPPDRLAYMLEDSGAGVLLTQESLAASVETSASVLVLERFAAEDALASPVPASLDDLAYVIYTSGSTGKPKGVAVGHRSLVNLLSSMQGAFRFSASDSLLAVATLSFDIAGLDLYLPLITGGRIVLASRDDVADGKALIERLAASRVTFMQATPATWRIMLEAGWTGNPGLKVLCGGEALPRDLANTLASMVGELWNGYGPTETTIYSSREHVVVEPGPVAIGRPIANTTLLILDRSGALVPVGVPGELHIGGMGLAYGYWRRADLTAERFIPDLVTGQPGRLYKTGDQCRFMADGRVEYLGRLDHQVKVRGYRIELEEIEIALRAHPDVDQSAVVAQKGDGGDDRLIAYLTEVAGRSADVADLRAHLRKTLPTYMVPSAFVTLDSLPLSPNGKVDRKALMMAKVAVAPAAPGAPLATPTEEIVAGLWSDVLGVQRIGAGSDFFELGGHSLNLTQVVTRVRKVFGVTVPFRDLFAAPTLAAFAARIDAARSAERDAAPVAALVAAPDTGRNPLSSAQQRLWFLNELSGDTAEYAIVGAVELAGSLDPRALEGALAQLVARHESLRTIFPSPDGEPVLVVQPAGHFELEMEEAPSQEVLRSRMKSAATRPFDLQVGPLFRCVLYRTAPDRHYLLLILHHIVADGWSIGVLMRELAPLYADAFLEQPPSLPPPPLQYRDYARWQRQQAGDGDHGGALARWVARLEGAPSELELPADRPRPPAESHRGAMHSFRLPMDIAEGLRALSRRQGATLFMTLLAVFDTLLWKYTGQQDLVVGTPVANRPRVELESVVGMFVNTLLLRTRLEPSLTFAEALGRVRESTLDALGDEEVPFERLVQALRPERDLSRNPLFQVMFVLQNMPQRPIDLPGLQLRAIDVDRGAAQLDLTLYMTETAEGLSGSIEYATDLFDADRIARMTGHFEQLARAVVAWPAARLGELDMLTEAEHANVAAWNQTAHAEPAACVHDLVAATARRQPEATALVCGDAALTYSELETRAAAIASRLAVLGARPGNLVGVLLERGPDMVAGVLGVLKAGAGYVPMDPAFPPERLSYMLEDSGATVLLTQESLAGSIATSAKVLVIERFADGDAVDVPAAATLDDLAYVIYTSGSTGKPKGVAIGHRSLVNLLASMQEEPGFTDADSLFAVTTLSFDIAGLELYLPLIAGGRIVLASRDEVGDGNALIERLEASRATVMQATPATWRLMLEAGWKGSPILKVLCGGEALPRDLADTLAPRVKELWNVYGPTETTIWSSCERVSVEPGPVAIGRPIANTSLLILDRSGGLAPVGVPGELHIGGMGLAHGYWRRDELTAERFVPDQVSGQPGKLYKTGDQARWLADGRVECLGRLDHQVKVRGYRIELEEIEIALRAHPDVDQSAVVAHQGEGGDDRLIAYLTELSGRPANVTELRAHLRQTLPAYMVPSAFVTLDRLPLTPNGKIDRKALRGIESGGAVRGEPLPPVTPTELVIARLWRNALKVQAVGLQDNFFDLGGHSLLAMRVLAEIEKHTGARLHPRDIIFQNLEQLARACDARALEAANAGPTAGADGKLRGLLRRWLPGTTSGRQ